MKQLTVVIRAELEVPDDWELVDHPSGMEVLKVGDRYVDFDLAPLIADTQEPDCEWSDADADLVNEVLDAMVGLDVALEIATHH